MSGSFNERDFEAAFGHPVKLINDAAMQALGSYRGGKMLFLGLGTGLGSAMVVDGMDSETVRKQHLQSLFAADLERGQRMSAEGVGLYFDYSKNRITDQTLRFLLQLTEECGLRNRIDAMFRGEKGYCPPLPRVCGNVRGEDSGRMK